MIIINILRNVWDDRPSFNIFEPIPSHCRSQSSLSQIAESLWAVATLLIILWILL